MGKRLVDIDDELLDAAREALSTTTIKETVNGALRMVAAQAARRRHVDRLRAGGLPDLLDPTVSDSAWR